jgi:hypothetical protein
MVDHNRRSTFPVGSKRHTILAREDSHGSDTEIDLAWGAEQVAIAIFGPPSASRAENRRRRRRVFCMHEQYVKALQKSKEERRPSPVNIGWVSLPQTNRIALCKRTYRAFVAAQLEDKQ